MCIQCMMGAMTAVGTANGTRAWIGHRFAERLGPTAMRRITIGLFAAAVLASGFILKSPAPTAHAVSVHPAAVSHAQ